jgi:hypothetical protein
MRQHPVPCSAPKNLVLMAHPLELLCLRRPRWQKSRLTSAPLRKSNKTKIDAERALAVRTPHGGSLWASYFDRSEWEIMYPLFVMEGLIDPSERVSRKDT